MPPFNARQVSRGLLAASLIAACVVFASGAARSAPPAGKESEAALRGERLALRACASCHGVGLTGESSWEGAPPFRNMRIDYNAISYARRMEQLHQGHVRMPPSEISLDDVRDIRAYARSLRRASEPEGR